MSLQHRFQTPTDRVSLIHHPSPSLHPAQRGVTQSQICLRNRQRSTGSEVATPRRNSSMRNGFRPLSMKHTLRLLRNMFPDAGNEAHSQQSNRGYEMKVLLCRGAYIWSWAGRYSTVQACTRCCDRCYAETLPNGFAAIYMPADSGVGERSANKCFYVRSSSLATAEV